MHKLIDYRDTWADMGIHIIKPRSGGHRTEEPERSVICNTELISDLLPEICKELGAHTVIWDTITATASAVLDEYAQSGLHKGAGTKEYRVVIGNEVMSSRLPPAMQDYGWAQTHMRLAVRDKQLNAANRNYHILHIAHQSASRREVGKDPDTKRQLYQILMHGPHAGGPAAVEGWGGQYQAVNRVYVDGAKDKAKRCVQLGPFDDVNGIPYAARTNVGGNIPNSIEIPGDFAGAVKVWEAIARAMALDTERPDRTGYYSGTIYGVMGSGKTRWASAFLGLANALPCVYVAADGDSEYLRSFWNELKQAKSPASEPSQGAN